MTVLGTRTKQNFEIIGGTTYDLAPDFLFLEDYNIFCVETLQDGTTRDLVLGTDYTVSGGDGGSGTVTTMEVLTGETLTVYRDVEAIQQYDARVGDGFNTDTFERQLDRMVMAIQETETESNGGIRLPITIGDEVSTVIPAPEPNMFIRWNADGTEFINSPGTDGGGGTPPDLTEYYKLDGSHPLTSNFRAGGHRLSDLADGVDETDAVTVQQARGVFNTLWHKDDFIDYSTGPADGGKPIILASTGKVDPSMLDFQSLVFVGEWTPTAGNEYPDTTGIDYGSYWMIGGLGAPYTFTGGDLAGQEAEDGDIMLWGSQGWMLKEVTLDPTAYYRIDGTIPLSADFQAGNHMLKNVAAGVSGTDGVNYQQVADAFTLFYALDGSFPLTQDFQAGGKKLTNLAPGVADTDAATVGQLGDGGTPPDLTEYYKLDGSQPITADFQAGGHKLTGLAPGVADTDAATVGQLGDGGGGDYLPITGGTITGNLAVDGITELHGNAYFDAEVLITDGEISFLVANTNDWHGIEFYRNTDTSPYAGIGLHLDDASSDDDLLYMGFGDEQKTVGVAVNSLGNFVSTGSVIAKGGFDAFNQNVTNLADGVNDSDAVNLSQLNGLTGVEDYFNIPGDLHVSGVAIFDGELVEVSGCPLRLKTSELEIMVPNDGTYHGIEFLTTGYSNYAGIGAHLSSDGSDDFLYMAFGAGDNKDIGMLVNSQGDLGASGQVIGMNGLAANDNKVTQVANGTNPTDAVNKSQLDAIDPSGNYLPVNGKAADSELVDGLEASQFVRNDVMSQSVETDFTVNGEMTIATGGKLTMENTSGIYLNGGGQIHMHIPSNGVEHGIEFYKPTNPSEVVGGIGGYVNPDGIGGYMYFGMGPAPRDTVGMLLDDAGTLAVSGLIVAMGGVDASNNKISNLADGTVASDAANFGQISALEARIATLESQVATLMGG